jgi:hypothetical protein
MLVRLKPSVDLLMRSQELDACDVVSGDATVAGTFCVADYHVINRTRDLAWIYWFHNAIELIKGPSSFNRIS